MHFQTKCNIEPIIAKTQLINSIECHPCHEITPGIIEQCEHEEAQFYSVYLHYVNGGLDAIADFQHQQQAEELTNILIHLLNHPKP